MQKRPKYHNNFMKTDSQSVFFNTLNVVIQFEAPTVDYFACMDLKQK